MKQEASFANALEGRDAGMPGIAASLWSVPRSISSLWKRLSLAKQFALASFIILSIGMVSMAAWVSSRIESGVVSNSALSAALFMDSFIAPLLYQLNTEKTLSADNQRELDLLLQATSLGEQVESFKIWGPEGMIVYSSNPSLIGQTFPVTDTQANAWNGKIEAEFDNLGDEEDAGERSLNIPLLEIYSPIRGHGGRIIAVSEFYTNAEQLEDDLFHASMQSWYLFGATGALMFAALSSIALRGSRTIQRQQSALQKRVTELDELRQHLKKASRRSTELNERFLRKVGSDLHDGPAQLLALALLKMEELIVRDGTDENRKTVVNGIQEPLQDALAEIRSLSAGLVLPGLEGKTVQQILRKAVSNHERRTGASVRVNVSDDGQFSNIPDSVRICVYRFAQETLNNAFFHGKTSNAWLKASFDDGVLRISTSDDGCGFDSASPDDTGDGLGLPGLRERIESVGGHFELNSRIGKGTVVQASFELQLE